MARDHRRLAAIVSADVAGYSRLMGRDEGGTLARLKAHRRELIDPKIAEYGGRIVKTTGDGLLLEFPSVVDAVRCAVDVQRGMAERNAGTVPDQRIPFRIGINVGDIIIDGDDIFGDGVNVAARLEALADPGGICVSRVVRDQVLDKLSFTFEDLGAQHVKNIVRPVDVYRIDLGGVPPAHRPERNLWQRATRVPHWRLFITAFIVVSLSVIGAWWLPSIFNAARVPPTPSHTLAILPFNVSTSDPAGGPLAETVSADLTSSLTRSAPYWSVVSPSVAAPYKGTAVNVREIGRQLDVRYIVEGVLRTAGERVEVKARLTETSAGTELWSDELDFDKAGDDRTRQVFIGRLTNQIRIALFDAETRRVLALPVSSLNANELTLRADMIQRHDPQSLNVLAEARSLYDKALRLNPTLPDALMSQANVLAGMLDRDPHADRDRLLREYDEMSVRLVAVAEREARAWNIRADALQRQGRWEAALEANSRAQKLDPARADTIGQRAHILIDMGQPDQALTLVDQGLSLQPRAQIVSYLMYAVCRANLALGRNDDAIDACEKAASLDDLSSPIWWSPHVDLMAAYALQGSNGKVDAEKAKVLAHEPRFSIAGIKAVRASEAQAYLQQTEAHLYAGLRKAGIPEQ